MSRTTYRPVNDRTGGRTTRTIKSFSGVHYNISKDKQPDEFAAMCDMTIQENTPRLRPGMRKIAETGYEGSVQMLCEITLGGGHWVGAVINGALQAMPVRELDEQVRRYYIWDETRREYRDASDIEGQGLTHFDLMTARTK